MNRDFIRLKHLDGELKLTQMTTSLGCSVTSKELVFLKPHTTYHLYLEDIVSMVPTTIPSQPISFRQRQEVIRAEFHSDYYKISVRWVRIVTRSGVSERENMEFIVPLSAKMLDYIAKYGGMQAIG